MDARSIWLGFDSREVEAFAVARHSIRRHLAEPIEVRGVVMADLVERGLYRRPTGVTTDANGVRKLTDVLSIRADYDGAMSTEFALTRFLVPHLAGAGWALFMDCDMLVRADVGRLFDAADPTKAVMVVKHDHQPTTTTKMDGQTQAAYARKNWSSVCLWNVEHPANRALTLDLINSRPGRDLHAFCWLADDDIGDLDPAWNWLASVNPPLPNPFIVHHTLGSPCLRGYEGAPYADEWRAELLDWAR